MSEKNLEEQTEKTEVDEKVDEETREEETDQLEKLESEVEHYKDSMMRLQADFENYKRRTRDEYTKQMELGVKNLGEDLIPVLDNLERAIASMEESKVDEETIKGIKLIEEQLIEGLKKHKIEEIKALNEEFDPNYHHAVVMVETDEADSNKVVDVLQKGYTINEKVIRPSMVKVSQ